MRGVADVLELVLVLVGPEAVDVVVWRVEPSIDSRRGAPLLLGVVVVLDAHAAEDRVELVRDVPGGEHVGRARAAALVDEHAV